jgi:hypothetical protein
LHLDRRDQARHASEPALEFLSVARG